MSAEDRSERKLGFGEKIFWIFDRTSCLNFTVTASIRGALTEEVLRTALREIRSRHPILKMRVEHAYRGSLKYISDGASEIPLNILNRPAEGLPAELQRELRSKFDLVSGPLSRCTLIQHEKDYASLLLTFHHSLGDAMSGVYVIRDLISAATKSLQGEDPSLPRLPLKKAMEDYFPKWVFGIRGDLLLIKVLSHLMSLAIRRGLPKMPEPDDKTPYSKRLAEACVHILDEDRVRKIISRSRRENTSVHGALGAAYVMSIARDRNSEKPIPVLIASDIDMRRFLAPDIADDFGFYISAIASIHQAGIKSDFWEVAREVRDVIDNGLESGEAFLLINTLAKQEAIHKIIGLKVFGIKTIKRLLDLSSPEGLVLSNIGNIELDCPDTHLMVEELGFASTAPGTYAVSYRGKMILVFVWPTPQYSPEHIRRLSKMSVDILIENSEY